MPAADASVDCVEYGRNSLCLQSREDGNYRSLLWREFDPEAKKERESYVQGEVFWKIAFSEAMHIMRQAQERNFFAPAFFRFKDKDYGVASTALHSPSSCVDEIVTKDPIDDCWRAYSDTRIIYCAEPWEKPWRKVIIYSLENDLATFRSLTKDREYEHKFRHTFRVKNGWYIDRAMPEADGRIFSLWLEKIALGSGA